MAIECTTRVVIVNLRKHLIAGKQECQRGVHPTILDTERRIASGGIRECPDGSE